MKTKVLLVYPEIPTTYWSFKYILPFLGKKAAYPPLSLLTVAALFPDSYQVRLIDMNVEPLNEEEVFDADIVFTSSMIVQKSSLEEIIKLCNRLNRPIVAGGPYPISSHENIEGVDYFVLNEAEITLPEFLEDFHNGRAKKIYSSEIKPDITMTPPPRFDLIDFNKYTCMALQYSRGCPFNCEFCDIIEMFGRKTRTKTPEQFIGEMQILYEIGYMGSLFIVDDNFIGNMNNVKMLLKAIGAWQKENGYPFMLFTEASINLAYDEELLDLMAEAGFNMVFVGIETPVKETLIRLNKSQNIKAELIDSIKKIQSRGMEVSAGFIVGFDSDPDDIFDLQVDFIQASGIPIAMIGLLTALPNTRLYRRLKSENRLLHQSSGNNTHDLQMNFIPVMDADKLVAGYKKVISRIYNPSLYFKRCLTLLKNLPKRPNSRGAITVSNAIMGIRALLFSLFKQTFSSYGFRYIHYMIKSLFIKPALFGKAVRLAVMEHHFHRITSEVIAVDNFKNYSERIARFLEERVEKISVNNIEESLKELLIFHKYLVSRIQKRYKSLHKDFHASIELSLKELANNFKQYLDKIVIMINYKMKKMSANNVDDAIKELRGYRDRIINKVRKRYSSVHGDLSQYVEESLENFEGIINRIISDWEAEPE